MLIILIRKYICGILNKDMSKCLFKNSSIDKASVINRSYVVYVVVSGMSIELCRMFMVKCLLEREGM